ncbi:MAG TPA: beta-ketoacyl-ACP synthase II [Planctomycetota bacterium]|nr:beta-ketoacyl-ACP synthase II [Planctomycetota bacterium]
MNTRRVVVTGLGGATSLGLTFRETWAGLVAGRNGISPITHFDPSEHTTKFAGVIRDYKPDVYFKPAEAKKLDLYTQYALVAAEECMKDSGLDLERCDRERIGVILGTGIGGINAIESEHDELHERGPRRVSPHFIPKMMPNAIAGQVSIRYGLQGSNYVTSSACASGAHALLAAFRAVQVGELDLCVSGGSESAITPLAVAAFGNMKALSTRNDAPERASRPFDKDRDGFVMGEGAGILLLEEREHALQRGARIYAEFLGYGSTADAFHITQPKEDGAGPRRAMALALAMGGLKPEDVDYVNAHGTSTHYNDLVETQAIHQVFGAHAGKLAVSSTKSMIGHLLGSSGALEAAVTCQTIAEQLVHPTRNHEVPGEGCDLDYVPGEARAMKVRAAISNSLGFGGHNACLLFGRHAG